MDDVSVPFASSESAQPFREYISSKHQSINFSVEQEELGLRSFLDVTICCKTNKFVTSGCKEPTFSGVFTNLESFILMYQ